MNTWKDEFDTDYVKYLKPTESFRGSNEIKLFIESLLKDQREEVVRNILMGFGVGTIEEYQISIIKSRGLNAPEPGVKK